MKNQAIQYLAFDVHQATVVETVGDEQGAIRMRATVPTEAIRLVELRARVPRYQKEMLHYLARRHETTVDEVLAREMEDVACAHAEELAGNVPGFETALA